jgi:hypothetical protein
MKKLIKYDILNSYKFIVTAALISSAVMIGQYLILKATGSNIRLNSVLALPTLAGLTVWLIGRFNDELKSGEGILIYITPNSKIKIFLSRLTTSAIWVTVAVLMFALINIITDYIPFLGVSSTDEKGMLTLSQISIIRLFSIGWNISYIMALVLLGMFASLITSSFIKSSSLSFILSAATYIILFIAFHAMLMFLITHFPLTYEVSSGFNAVPGVDMVYEHGGYTFFGGSIDSNYGAVFTSSYNRIRLGIMGIVGNNLISLILFSFIAVLMERRLEI